MAVFKRGEVWWYKFYFAGRCIRESSKSTSKTVAKAAEQRRRRELEAGFHNIQEERQQRIRPLKEVIKEYLQGYRLRYVRSEDELHSELQFSRILRACNHAKGR
jgi:predicted solute-binding protein